MPNSEDAHPKCRGLLIAHVVRDLELRVALRYAVLGEAAVLELDGIDAVREACYAVAFFPLLRYFRADLFDRAGVVAADCGAGRGEEVDVLPVGGV